MSSLINSALSGLTAAQAAINTTSNNISNYTVSGYTRQTVSLSQASSTMIGNSYYGNGVNVVGINREYDSFITNQLRGASASSSALTAQYNQISNIDDLFASSTTSLSSTLQGFFTAVQNVVSSADDASARQTLLSQAQGLVSQFKTTDEYLRNLDAGVNTTISSSVEQINAYATQIASLNQQITKLTAAGGSATPNNLLDQRDQLVSDLNNIIGVTVSEQDGNYNISVGNGITLVTGNNTRQLVAMNSSSDASKLTVGYVDSAAGNVEIPESQITTGSLAGTLKFRTEDLTTARNNLNQMALVFADAFNEQHEAGFDADGAQGVAFFNIGAASVNANSKNTGTASLAVTSRDSSEVQATDYKVAYNGTSWTVTRLSDNTSATVTTGTNADTGEPTLNFDGLEVTISDSAGVAAKDSFVVKPVSNAIVNMSVAITDEGQVAAASSATSGVSDNNNAQKLLNLQSASLVNGKKTLSQAYAQMVSVVGNKTNSLETASTTQAEVVTQLTERQQSISGVSLDEEYVNLQQFQQYYLANAQVLQTASTIFDALMGIR